MKTPKNVSLCETTSSSPMAQYGAIILVFCACNTFVIVMPYSDISDKGLELTMIPALFACIVTAYHAYLKRFIPVNFKFDVSMIIVISLISLATFNLPNSDMIWLMMGFILFVYIPFFLILFARGLIFMWKGSRDKLGKDAILLQQMAKRDAAGMN